MDQISERLPVGGPAAYDAYKRELIRSLDGVVLEVGAGRGANFGMLGSVSQWIGVEPSRARRAALRVSAPIGAEILDGRAEALPLDDASVDNVLSTIVLCSVRDHAAALAEIARVIRPGGRFVFFEHVAAPRRTWRYRAQRVAAPVSRVFDHGCDPTRRTWESLGRSGLAITGMRWFELPVGFGLRMPYIGGCATAAP